MPLTHKKNDTNYAGFVFLLASTSSAGIQERVSFLCLKSTCYRQHTAELFLGTLLVTIFTAIKTRK
jgi:hypothetical protein